jgi:PTH1 family peptidyl-tRNA hydrolase
MSNVLCFAGLGNPGPQYKGHRHNIGAQLIELLSRLNHVELQLHVKTNCLSAITPFQDKKIHFVVPQSYMNESGYPIAQYLHFYKIASTSLVVVHDELDFSAGELRLKLSGGHGGHNGLRSLHQHLGTADYKRLRIGIGHPGDKDKVAAYVLSQPSREQELLFKDLFHRIELNWSLLAEERWDEIARVFHKD